MPRAKHDVGRAATALLTLLVATLIQGTALANEQQVALVQRMVDVQGGQIELLFPVEGEEVTQVEPFRLDAVPVTNEEYRQFVLANPEWSRSVAPEVFVGRNYLPNWASDTDTGELAQGAPVTNVSWFAAAAYCDARGARLPTEAEWEFAAAAGFDGPEGKSEPGFNEKILSLTSVRSHVPGPVGQSAPNYYGLHDMHGLVWEWVFDLGANMATSDSRSEGDRRLQLVCGGGSAGATDKTDFAGFLRYAFRGSLEGNYASGGLGFRCATGPTE